MNDFTGPDGHADVTVLIVTYNSADDIDALLASLRPEAEGLRLRVVVVDNRSTDGTLDRVRAHGDVIAVDGGGNLGYSGGVNVAIRAAGQTDAYLLLNPDLVVRPGCVAALRARRRRHRAGIVVPTIVDAGEERTASIRHEPSLARALGDAVFGGRRRPAFAPGEIVTAAARYAEAGLIEWATGAAMLIDAQAAAAVGQWDERFFLYSEETDYCRRMRDAGYEVWFEPAAVVRHVGGRSGASLELEKLMAVNRIRYARLHLGRPRASLYRAVVVLHELARSTDRRHRAILRTVLSEASWQALPRATPPETSR